MEIQNESNQKIHYKDGDMVEDIDYLDDHNSDSEPESEDPNSEEDQNPRSESEDSEKSDDNEKDGPRRSKRPREPPERLNPTMKGQSYGIRKMNIDMKRKMKKDIKMRTKKKFREEHYNLYTQGIRREADCREYTNLEGIILAMSMVKFNEFVDVGYQSYSQQYQLGKSLKKLEKKVIKYHLQSLNSFTTENVFTQCQLKI